MKTKPQSGIRSLSEQAQAILHRLLDQQVPPESIARVIWLQTRENVEPGAITRYASRYRKRRQEQQRVKEKLDGFIARAQQEGISISDLLRAFLLEKFSQAQRDGSLKKVDFLTLENAERRRGEFELKQRQAQLSAAFRERELQLKERNAKLAEKRFRLARDKANSHVQALEEKITGGQSLTQDDLRKIREIYGLYEAG